MLFRKLFPIAIAALLLAALGWALSFSALPPASFTFDNGTEVQTLDPAKATGNPENRVINALFEGLLRGLPPEGYREQYGPHDNVPLTPRPAMAESYDVSDDGKTYTFHMRPGALWSDGSPVTAGDFAWSWQRMLHPETGSEYGYQLYYVRGTQAYNLARVEPGDRVEVELRDRPRPLQNFPRGTLVRGTLEEITKPPEPVIPPKTTEDERSKILADWKTRWVYHIAAGGKTRLFSQKPEREQPQAEPCHYVLPDWEATVGIRAPDDRTLIVELNQPTPFFNELVAFYPLYPVHRPSVERHGTPDWTQPDKLVGNGPYSLQLRRLRDRLRLVKNPQYWQADRVRLNVIDVLALRDETTALNMYLTDRLDWATSMPAAMIPQLKQKLGDEFPSAPQLTVYFYRLNVNRPGLQDKRVRQALNLALDKAKICQFVTKAGEQPAGTFVPPGLAGYESPPGHAQDVARAQALLAEAGFPGGRGLPRLEILYNDNPALHRIIAEAVQQMWKESLGVDVELRSLEWGVYLDAQDRLDYSIARAGWIADYPDPNTFLDMWVTGGQQNKTGWSHPRYDELIAAAAQELNPERRMGLFREAEALLLDETPIVPMYFYVSKNLVKPRVRGFFNSVSEMHPLTLLEIADPQGARP